MGTLLISIVMTANFDIVDPNSIAQNVIDYTNGIVLQSLREGVIE